MWRLDFTRRWVALLIGVGVAVTVVLSPAIPQQPFFVAVTTAVVVSFVALGHYLFEQYGERFTGLCFMVAAGGFLVANLDVHARWGTVVSWLLGGTLVYGSIGWGVLRYGRERLDRAGRRWVLLCVAGTAGTSTPLMLVSRPEWLTYSADAVWPSPWADSTASTVLNVVACLGYLVIGYCFARVTLRRLRTAPPALRRTLRPLTLAGAAWGGIAALVTVVGSLAPDVLSVHANSSIVGVLSIGVTAALATAINRSRLLAATFVDTLPDERTPESLTGYVRAALSDPSAELLFRVPGSETLIDGSGRVRTSPLDRPADRFTQWMHGSGDERVAVLVGDPTLGEDPSAVRSLAKVLSLAAENQQLHAVLRMRLAQLGSVRTAERLAFDRAREQFRRDLHDGVQQTIAAARMDLDGLRDDPDDDGAVDRLDGKLTVALDQIRNLQRGTCPPELSFGLGPAIDRMVAELRIDAIRRIDGADLGTAFLPVYYLVREALTNSHKHAPGAPVEIDVRRLGATLRVRVTDGGPGGAVVRPGGGLAGLQDRVAELGGCLTVESPQGAGTTIDAVIPVTPT